MAINLKKPSPTELSCFLTWKKFRSLYSDGSFREKNGRLKKFPFVITAGKPNGSLKGADRIDSSRRIRVYYTCTASSPEQAETDAGITDLVTWSMKDGDGKNGLLPVGGLLSDAERGSSETGRPL